MIIVVHRLNDSQWIVSEDAKVNFKISDDLLENPYGGEFLAAFFGKDKESIKEAIEAISGNDEADDE